MIIGINCGHTVSGTPGCGAVGIMDESTETRNVGRALMDQLRKNGHTVVDCTNDRAATTSANLAEICALANAQPLDLFVSIHFNSGGGHGTETFTYNAQKHTEAKRVCENMAALGFTDRGVKDGSNLYVIRHTAARAILVETCFVDSAADAQLYKKIGAETVADAICRAITGGGKEDIGMDKYEELKRLIEANGQKITALENEIKKPKMIYNYVDANMPEWAREAVKWCADNGIVAGDGNGLNLDEHKLWTCVLLYRLSKLG